MEKITFVNENEPYLSAENLNAMQDNIEEAIKDTYSTEEQHIGYWIDGKPLYRKVITTTEAIEGGINLQINHGVTNYDKMWVDLGNSYYYNSETTRSLPIEQTFYTTAVSAGKAHVYTEGDYIYLVSSGGWSTSWEKVVTLLYTKTTD